MSKVRITRWTASGALVGTVLAVLALSDARQLTPYPPEPSDRINFYMCWWMILGFAPWHYPIALLYVFVAFLNACTYALLFLIIGITLRAFASRTIPSPTGAH
jgi:hypothetical protein